MNFKSKLSTSIMTLLILSLIIPSCTEKKEAENTSPTNIILIVADDLGYGDISAANLASDVNTPNIDRIAESGIRFAQTYDNSPICNQ